MIGNLKGIPYQARHEANVNRLAIERERLLELRENLRDWKFVLERAREVGIGQTISDLRHIDDKLKALDVLERQAEHNSIISLDTSGERVRAAVAIGDVDNADYVAVHTPGMNSAVEDNMNRYVDELREVTQYAQDMLVGTDKTVATVVWMDYLPPKTSVDEIVEGIFDDRAEDGAKRLAAELEGLQASRMDHPPDRVTAIGHSYGSLTTALALREDRCGRRVRVARLAGVERRRRPEGAAWRVVQHAHGRRPDRRHRVVRGQPRALRRCAAVGHR